MVGPKPDDLAPSVASSPTQPYSTPFTDFDGHLSGTPLTFEVGTMFGPYRIEQKLGQGGMGVVFRAIDTTLDRVVAFKVMRPELLSRPNFKERFLREAKAAAQVMHANVVVIHQAGELHGTLFMAFEYVPGGDLSTRLESGPMAPADAVRLLIECASGLDAIHQAGMVHRDIKPQNIFLDKQGRSKLGDLGLARSVQGDDRMTMTGVAIGTPAFMSPEQIEGDPNIDIRSDIHALGATLFNTLTGHPPFEGNTVFSITHKIMGPDRPSLRERHPQIPERLQRIVHKAMARDRADRYQTPQELIDDLRGRGPMPALAKTMPQAAVPPSSPGAPQNGSAAAMATVITPPRGQAVSNPQHGWGLRWMVLAAVLVVACLWLRHVLTHPVAARHSTPVVAVNAHAPSNPSASSHNPPLPPLPVAPSENAAAQQQLPVPTPITPVIIEPAAESPEHPLQAGPNHALTQAQELANLQRHFGLDDEDARHLQKLLLEFRERRAQILRDSNDDFSPGTLAQIRHQREHLEIAAAAFLDQHQQELLKLWLTPQHYRVRTESASGP